MPGIEDRLAKIKAIQAEAEAKKAAEKEKTDKESTEKKAGLEQEKAQVESELAQTTEELQKTESGLAEINAMDLSALDAESRASIESEMVGIKEEMDNLSGKVAELTKRKQEIDETLKGGATGEIEKTSDEEVVELKVGSAETEVIAQRPLEAVVAEKTPDVIVPDKIAEVEGNGKEKMTHDLEEKVKVVITALKEMPQEIKNKMLQRDLKSFIELNDEDPKKWAHKLNLLIRKPDVDFYVSEQIGQAKYRAHELLNSSDSAKKIEEEIKAAQNARPGEAQFLPYNSRAVDKEFKRRIKAEQPIKEPVTETGAWTKEWAKRRNEIFTATEADVLKEGIAALKEYEAGVKSAEKTPDYSHDVLVIEKANTQYGGKIKEILDLQDQLKAAEQTKK